MRKPLLKLKQKFHFNREKLIYEPINYTFGYWFRQIGVYLLTGALVGGIFFLIYLYMVEPPGEKELRQEKKRILSQYDLLNYKVKQYEEVLFDLQQRDENLYRVVFQAEPIPFSVRKAGYNANRYDILTEMTNSQLVASTTRKVDEFARQLYIQSKSFDEIVVLANNKEQMLACIPAIQPIYNKDLKHMASGFGMRIDPVYRTPKFHAGMDFSAPIGTKIFATGNGTISFAGWKQGYGNTVVINHGFNYETLYGHMNSIGVYQGQKVKRGETIGMVGNTGKSVGPHLHYEVHFKGSPVNPQNYYFLDLSPAEYDKMLQMVANSAQVFD